MTVGPPLNPGCWHVVPAEPSDWPPVCCVYPAPAILQHIAIVPPHSHKHPCALTQRHRVRVSAKVSSARAAGVGGQLEFPSSSPARYGDKASQGWSSSC